MPDPTGVGRQAGIELAGQLKKQHLVFWALALPLCGQIYSTSCQTDLPVTQAIVPQFKVTKNKNSSKYFNCRVTLDMNGSSD